MGWIKFATPPCPSQRCSVILVIVPDPTDLAADVALRLVIARDDELDAMVTETLALLARRAGADRSYVTLYHEDGTFENSHEWTPSDVVPQLPVIQRLRSEDFAFTYHMVLRNEVLSAPDLMALPDEATAEKQSFSSFGVKAVLQVPIIVNGEGIGLVGFNNFHTDVDWPDELVDFIRRVGQAIGIAITRQRATRRIRRAYDEAERAIAAKDELLAHISHELRTPLHAILGYAELLEIDARPEGERNALLEIQVNGRRLLSMVDDLIELADESVSLSQTQPTGVAQAVQTAIGHLAPVAESRRVSIDCADSLDDSVIVVEPGRLRQVVYYALSAALQSVPRGGEILVGTIESRIPTISVAIRGTGDLETTGLVMPMAQALMTGHGSIELELDSDDLQRARIVIEFDQGARP